VPIVRLLLQTIPPARIAKILKRPEEAVQEVPQRFLGVRCLVGCVVRPLTGVLRQASSSSRGFGVTRISGFMAVRSIFIHESTSLRLQIAWCGLPLPYDALRLAIAVATGKRRYGI
jgi:hypothetical protein